MPLDDLSKDNSGIGLQKYWKDLFPDSLTKLYVYKATNMNHRGRDIFSREDDLSIIGLELIDTIDGIFGGSAYTVGPLSVEEDKTIKELELNNIPSKSFTAFLSDINHNFDDHNLFYSLSNPFNEGNINDENLNVFISVQTNPGVLNSILRGSEVDDSMIGDLNKTIISWTFSPAVLQNNLQSSKVSFVNKDTHLQMPKDKNKFKITSIEIEADQSFAPEYGNWVRAKGIVESNGLSREDDIDFKMDKELFPLRISPYGKSTKVEFTIRNFYKRMNMPWIFAKHFLGADRTIGGYIARGADLSDQQNKWLKDLITSIINMFKMAAGYNTGFREYRDPATGEILNQEIGGVAIKSLEGKEKDASTSITQVLKNWEYANSTHVKSQEYIRAIQVLTASSEWVPSEYSFGKTTSQAHKSELDFFLDLGTEITKDTISISMKLNSLRYEFDISDTSNVRIKGLKKIGSASNIIIDSTDSMISLPTLDNPINIYSSSGKPGDINLRSQNFLNYFVGIDITKPSAIEQFLIDNETAGVEIKTINTTVDTLWHSEQQIGIFGWPQDTLKGITTEEAIYKSANIPPSAFDVSIKSFGTQTSKKFTVSTPVISIIGQSTSSRVEVTAYKNEGAVVEYKIQTKFSNPDNREFSYDKPLFLSSITPYLDNPSTFKRILTISDRNRDANGNPTFYIKEIQRIEFSFFLGNYVDIKFNWEYEDENKNIITGNTSLPRINLPSVHDERITKLGIRL